MDQLIVQSSGRISVRQWISNAGISGDPRGFGLVPYGNQMFIRPLSRSSQFPQTLNIEDREDQSRINQGSKQNCQSKGHRQRAGKRLT